MQFCVEKVNFWFLESRLTRNVSKMKLLKCFTLRTRTLRPFFHGLRDRRMRRAHAILCREGEFLVPRVPLNQKCKQDETPQVFYFTDAHSTTIFSWLEGSAYETSACNSVHALTLNACSTALQFCRTTIVQHTDRRKEIVQLL